MGIRVSSAPASGADSDGLKPGSPARYARPPGLRAPRFPLPFIERHHIALFLILTLIGSARIVSTYRVFSHTADEAWHIACGMEWLADAHYTLNPEQPPLSRVAMALGPYLTGTRPYHRPGAAPSLDQEMDEILYSGNHYERTLALARLGILPFFWIACAVVYFGGKRYFGPATAVLAVFLFSFLPPVLAHAGLATTDMACTALMGAVLLAAGVLLEEPSALHAAVFGLCGGLAILSKFSVLVFFPACAAAALVCYLAVARPGTRKIVKAGKALLPLLVLATAIACAIVWAGYRFSLDHRLPAPELWAGFRELWEHNARGHRAYALGRLSDHGFWYFFPLALAVKTPISFLILAGAGLVLAVRNRSDWRAWLPVACSAPILGTAMFSGINIGLRHILPIYIGLSLLGAVALAHAWSIPRQATWIRAAVPFLLFWLAASSLLNHPDYLAYFNEFAGRQPEKVLVDSDLDWGQDVKRLGLRLQAAGAHSVTFAAFVGADFKRQPGFQGIVVQVPPDAWAPATPSAGWNAVSLTLWKKHLGPFQFLPGHAWPDKIPPRERVGKSILLWYFPGSRP